MRCTSPTIPAADDQWLEGGGHHALEPFVGLAFAAAATTTLRLQTHVYVAAYRNPFLAAKGVATLDALSGGRVHPRGRGRLPASGVRRAGRGLRRAQRAARRVHRGDEAGVDRGLRSRSRAGTSSARSVTMRPRPASRPHPPIWVGGNSNRAMRRAVELGQGWVPFPNPVAAARATKTPSITSMDELADAARRRPRPRARRSVAPSRSTCASRRSDSTTTRRSTRRSASPGSRCSSTT